MHTNEYSTKNETIKEVLIDIRNAMLASKCVLTVAELEKYSGIARSTIYKYTHSRKIPHSKPTGKLIFFEREQIDEWLLSNRSTILDNY